MEIINFVKKLMNDDYKIDTTDSIIKYYNLQFEIIIYKERKTVKNPNLLIIDKRTTKHIIYNDLSVANNMINV
jgi:hypothetical protein